MISYKTPASIQADNAEAARIMARHSDDKLGEALTFFGGTGGKPARFEKMLEQRKAG